MTELIDNLLSLGSYIYKSLRSMSPRPIFTSQAFPTIHIHKTLSSSTFLTVMLLPQVVLLYSNTEAITEAELHIFHAFTYDTLFQHHPLSPILHSHNYLLGQ